MSSSIMTLNTIYMLMIPKLYFYLKISHELQTNVFNSPLLCLFLSLIGVSYMTLCINQNSKFCPQTAAFILFSISVNSSSLLLMVRSKILLSLIFFFYSPHLVCHQILLAILLRYIQKLSTFHHVWCISSVQKHT